jgi:hypothetical protein
VSGARAVAALAAWLALGTSLAACPLPQPVPSVEGDITVTPPRIVTESMLPADATVVVGTGCPAESFIAFGGSIDDPDLDDAVEARWFIDYSAGAAGVLQNDFPAASTDGTNSRRALADFRFFPSRYPAGPHVVEVVVSNGFFPIGQDPPGALQPNRTPQSGYETQVFRWTVVHEPGGRCE